MGVGRGAWGRRVEGVLMGGAWGRRVEGAVTGGAAGGGGGGGALQKQYR